MRLLILGGTLYLGRHAVEAALARGHEVTIFTRGKTNPGLFPQVEHLIGDRESNLEPLRGRTWDAVIDTSGYVPAVVRASAELLKDQVGYWCFVSTISVYADNTKPGIVETDPVVEMPEGAEHKVTGETYGPLKALCEKVVEEVFPGRCSVIRAGLIFGPHDSTERSGYWPARVARGGEVLAPGRADRPVQLVDVRDLADWLVRMCEAKTVGIFNATGPDYTLTMGVFLDACREASKSEAKFTWVDEDWLMAQEVGPYNELPLWVPEKYHCFETVNCRPAFEAGLKFRSLVESLRDTLEWHRSLPPGPRPANVGVQLPGSMKPDREKELLRLWKREASSRV